VIFGVKALAAERRLLVERCDTLRREIAGGIEPLARKVVAADRLVRAARRLTPLLLVYSFLKKR
jgi:hypothetical protein